MKGGIVSLQTTRIKKLKRFAAEPTSLEVANKFDERHVQNNDNFSIIW